MKQARSHFFRIVIFLTVLVFFAGSVCACQTTPPSDDSSQTISGGTSSVGDDESSDDLPKTLYQSFQLSADSLPAMGEHASHTVIQDDDNTMFSQFCEGYTGQFPAIADIVCTEKECFVCVVYHVERREDGVSSQVTYSWLSIDVSNPSFGEPLQDAPIAYVYDKNQHNQAGYFWIDYGTAESGSACPYVLLYHENGEDRPLIIEETAKAYARIIRQCDQYAVLSILEGNNRYYQLIDSTGKTISELEWISDISVTAPLAFYGDMLYCKTDTDEDYVYDTIGVIDLKDGTYRDLLSVGNCDYWTYFADGSGIAVYGKADGSSEAEGSVAGFQYYQVSDGKLQTIAVNGSIEMLEAAESIFYGISGTGDRRHAFVWLAGEEALFESEQYSAQCRFSFGNTVFAVLDQGVVTVYTRAST